MGQKRPLDADYMRKYDIYIKSDLYTSKETYKRGKLLKRDHQVLIVEELRYGNMSKETGVRTKRPIKEENVLKETIGRRW